MFPCIYMWMLIASPALRPAPLAAVPSFRLALPVMQFDSRSAADRAVARGRAWGSDYHPSSSMGRVVPSRQPPEGWNQAQAAENMAKERVEAAKAAEIAAKEAARQAQEEADAAAKMREEVEQLEQTAAAARERADASAQAANVDASMAQEAENAAAAAAQRPGTAPSDYYGPYNRNYNGPYSARGRRGGYRNRPYPVRDGAWNYDYGPGSRLGFGGSFYNSPYGRGWGGYPGPYRGGYPFRGDYYDDLYSVTGGSQWARDRWW